MWSVVEPFSCCCGRGVSRLCFGVCAGRLALPVSALLVDTSSPEWCLLCVKTEQCSPLSLNSPWGVDVLKRSPSRQFSAKMVAAISVLERKPSHHPHTCKDLCTCSGLGGLGCHAQNDVQRTHAVHETCVFTYKHVASTRRGTVAEESLPYRPSAFQQNKRWECWRS